MNFWYAELQEPGCRESPQAGNLRIVGAQGGQLLAHFKPLPDTGGELTGKLRGYGVGDQWHLLLSISIKESIHSEYS